MLSRRQFVTSALIGRFLCPGALARHKDPPGKHLAAESIGIAAVVDELLCPDQLGRASLRALIPNAAPASHLTQLVIGDLEPNTDYCSVRSLKRALGERIRKDFEEERIANVEGWFLSLTEIRLYALAFLRQKPNSLS